MNSKGNLRLCRFPIAGVNFEQAAIKMRLGVDGCGAEGAFGEHVAHLECRIALPADVTGARAPRSADPPPGGSTLRLLARP